MSQTMKEERRKEYFIQAAEEIIRGEGLQAASARNIAERAGYSYATIYNYFDDLPDLYAHVARSILKDCQMFIQNQTKRKATPEERVYEKTKWFAMYFIQYPSLFGLFFEKAVASAPDLGLDDFFRELVGEKALADSPGFHRFTLAVHGLLLFSLNRGRNISYEKTLKELEELRLD